MVDGVEQSVLLARMRQLRRRHRWTNAREGGAGGAALTAAVLAVATWWVRADGRGPSGLRNFWMAVLAGAIAGAAARACKRIPLTACARAVDRAAATDNDDCVLAAVSLLQGSVAPTPFVTALEAAALERTQQISARQAVAVPKRRSLGVAVLGIGGLALAMWGPSPGHRARPANPPATDDASRALAGHSEAQRIPPLAVSAEMDQAARAARAARDNLDGALARAADEFHRLLAALALGADRIGVEDRLQSLNEAAENAAAAARQAQAAAAAARAALGQGRRRRGPAGAPELAAAMTGDLTAAAGAEAAGAAAVQLAAGGDLGRRTLADTAGAAARILREGSQLIGGAGHAADTPPRRLGGDSAAAAAEKAAAGRAAEANPPQDRQLERLRRDLESASTHCRQDPETCQRDADNAGRALSTLDRQGRAADARRRFASATQQLLERVRRGEDGALQPDGLKRFDQAARGQNESGDGDPPRVSSSGSDGDPPPGGRASGSGSIPFGSAGAGDSSHARAPGRNHAGDPFDPPDAHGLANDPATSPANGGLARAGGGIGDTPGGPVLGPLSQQPRSLGRDTAAAVPADPRTGETRSATIQGAAARGFATATYRQTFAAYEAAAEESEDAPEIPAEQRYMVRRYFQLIRPRGAP